MSQTKRSKFLSILLIITVFLNLGGLAAKSFNEISSDQPELSTSGLSLGTKPIVIMNDTDLDKLVLDYSLNGTGTELDPYVCRNSYRKYISVFNNRRYFSHKHEFYCKRSWY